jgi:hypothetical protein
MQVILGKRLVVEEQLNMKGSTPDVEFKVELLDLFISIFFMNVGYCRGSLKSRRLLDGHLCLHFEP